MDAKTELRYVAGRDWKGTEEIMWEALRNECLGDLLDHRLKEIASELTVLEVLRNTYFDEAEDKDFYEDVHGGKSLDVWIGRLIEAVRRGPIERSERRDEKTTDGNRSES